MSLFDTYVERKGTGSVKYDFPEQFGKSKELMPLWIADMDFKAPQPVLDALAEKSRYGVFGYTDSMEEYFQALYGWFEKYHDWKVEQNWLVKVPGVVFAFSMAIRALSEPGDSVIIQQPTYRPFAESIRLNGRKLVVSQLVYDGKRYSVDFSDFESKIKENAVKLFILCSPHNPVGRVWSKKELRQLGDICLRYGVKIVSDEVHQDFVYPGHKHTVFAALGDDLADNSVICTNPSKSFNLAGLQNSNIFIPNESIREKFKNEIEKTGYGEPNIMGMVACQAAYSKGRPWFDELMEYLAGNLSLVKETVSRVNGLEVVEPEGTYVAWLDFSGMGLDADGIDDLVMNRAGLWLDPGRKFGQGGEQFQRLNMACPRSTLAKALDKLEKACKDRI